jgi:hypothetical protein
LVLLVAGLKGKRGGDEVSVDIVDTQPSATRVEGRFDPDRTMVVIP